MIVWSGDQPEEDAPARWEDWRLVLLVLVVAAALALRAFDHPSTWTY